MKCCYFCKEEVGSAHNLCAYHYDVLKAHIDEHIDDYVESISGKVLIEAWDRGDLDQIDSLNIKSALRSVRATLKSRNKETALARKRGKI